MSTQAPLITEDALAMRFAERECGRVRYICEWKKWVICGTMACGALMRKTAPVSWYGSFAERRRQVPRPRATMS